MNGNVFVFRPGAPLPLAPNVFNDWHLLMSAMSGVEGRKILEFDDSLVAPPPTQKPCEIPAGNWSMKDVMWAGFGPRPGWPRTIVAILSGAVFTDLRMIGGQITIVNQATSPAPSPVSDFGPGPNHVQIGLRDDGGNTQLVNQDKVPMFDLGDKSALFFLQNCLFGMPIARATFPSVPDIPNPEPLIRHRAPSQLTLNLLGQNQTGPNVVLSELGAPDVQKASVLFAALSSAAQVAVDQSKITQHGVLSIGPLGRIQRDLVPLPPKAPATTSQALNKPNVLVRCDGHSDFTQDLPGIASTSGTGFTIGNTPVKLYTGGQEVVVAEVAGGSKLKVRPTSGDTIDGSEDPVPIGKHGSRTFVSDGVSNWITISKVH